jgi:hypothetical protein
MMASRTAYVDLSVDKKLPSLHKLRKFTTQGSALTFPVQSIVFFCIVVGTQLVGRRVTQNSIERIGKQVRIFGDDIIVPKDWVEDVKRALELLWLKVNTKKTHYHGNFRESCGMDAFRGCDVTPPYVSRFSSVSGQSVVTSVVQSANNHFLKGLWNASDFICSTVPDSIRNFIPIRIRPDCSVYLQSFSGNWVHPSVKERRNSDYQIKQWRLFVSKTKKKPLKVDGSRHLAAFLATANGMARDLIFGGLEPISFSSRWESRPVEGREWVSLINS